MPVPRGTAVLLIDVINALDFPDSSGLVRGATRAAPRIEKLCERARAARVPIIYVNDNFGQWRSDFRMTLSACTSPDKPGARVSSRLRPLEGDYFVLKPQHSGFYSTPLELLLRYLRVRVLVLTGFAADLCVLFTAHDAHMRGYRVIVPSDCTAANTAPINRAALTHVRTALHGATPVSSRLVFGREER